MYGLPYYERGIRAVHGEVAPYTAVKKILKNVQKEFFFFYQHQIFYILVQVNID